MLCLVCYLFVISTSVIDCLGRFVPEMTYYMSSGMLNLTNLKLFLTDSTAHILLAGRRVRNLNVMRSQKAHNMSHKISKTDKQWLFDMRLARKAMSRWHRHTLWMACSKCVWYMCGVNVAAWWLWPVVGGI